MNTVIEFAKWALSIPYLIFIAVVLLFLFTFSNAWAEDKDAWTLNDTLSQAAVLIALNVDRAQTAGSPDMKEIGFAQRFIGDHPTSGDANRYFVAAGLIHTGVAMMLPVEWKIEWLDMKLPVRRAWQSTWFVVEVSTIGQNVSAGVSIQF